jgi:hypothetical protein
MNTKHRIKTILPLAVVAAVFALAPAVQAEVIPPIDYDGPYRLAMITTSMADATFGGATSTDIADYNAFVTAAANLVPDLVDLETTWKCIGSTLTVDAKVNTGTYTTADGGDYNAATDVPIYTTTGLRIAANNDALWGGSGIENIISFDDGTVVPPYAGPQIAPCFTGTRDTGLGDGSADIKDDNVLGSPNGGGNYIIVTRGGGTTSNNNDTGWIDGPSDHAEVYWLHHLMGLSDVIGGVPAAPFAITEIDYASTTGMLTLTWTSKPNETYGVYYSTDMTNWESYVDDSVPADAVETTTTVVFDLNGIFPGPDGIPERVYFRVQK